MSKRKLTIISLLGTGVVVGLVVGLMSAWSAKPTPPTSAPTDDQLLGTPYRDDQTGIQIRFPKGWAKVATVNRDPAAVVDYQNPTIDQEGSARGHASAGLRVTPATAGIEAYMRAIIEDYLNTVPTAQLVEHKRITLKGAPTRLITYTFPGPSGVKGRVTRYVIEKNGRFYDVSYTVLDSKWPSYQAAVEASIRSLIIR